LCGIAAQTCRCTVQPLDIPNKTLLLSQCYCLLRHVTSSPFATLRYHNSIDALPFPRNKIDHTVRWHPVSLRRTLAVQSAQITWCCRCCWLSLSVAPTERQLCRALHYRRTVWSRSVCTEINIQTAPCTGCGATIAHETDGILFSPHCGLEKGAKSAERNDQTGATRSLLSCCQGQFKEYFTMVVVVGGGGRFSVISTVSSLRAGLSGVRILSSEKPSSKRPHQVGGPTAAHSIGPFPPRTKRTVRQVGHLPAFRAEVEWSSTSISPIYLQGWCRNLCFLYCFRRGAQIS
jgi:hypothetical protein